MINKAEWEDIFRDAFRGDVEFDAPMNRFTSLRIGGPADILVSPEEPLSMRNLMVVLGGRKIPFLPLGSGTNVLVMDRGIEGVVVRCRSFNRIEVLREGNTSAELFVEAGVMLQTLVSFCSDRGYSGLEGLAGIPGTVGGAIYGNAGSFGCEMKDVVDSVVLIDGEARLDRVDASDLGFGYRRSGIGNEKIIMNATLRLKRDDIKTVKERTLEFLKEKRNKQPITERSAGCVFKNPEGLSAGKLIDEAGCKGMKIGDIEVSSIHANFFINRGGGTASDFLNLMDKVRTVVDKKFGIILEPEIRIIGRM